MPICLLVRHGENDFVKEGRLAGRLPDVHLNEKGRAQAQAVADLLADKKIQAIYSSPLERTLETAEPLAAKKGIPLIRSEGLVEVDFGEWQGQRLKPLSRLKLWRVVQGAPSLMQFPGGETFVQAQHRICQELERLAAAHKEKDVFVCFTHSDVIKLAVAFYLGLPLDLFQRLHVSPGSITSLSFGEVGRRLISLNYEPIFNIPKG